MAIHHRGFGFCDLGRLIFWMILLVLLCVFALACPFADHLEVVTRLIRHSPQVFDLTQLAESVCQSAFQWRRYILCVLASGNGKCAA